MVAYYPILATILIDLANIGHIIRMFQVKSSEGFSVTAILMVILALGLWGRFYQVETPEQKIAIWSTFFGVVFNVAILASVLYFRYFY